MTKFGIATNLVPHRCLQCYEKKRPPAFLLYMCIYIYVCIKQNFKAKVREFLLILLLCPSLLYLVLSDSFLEKTKKGTDFKFLGCKLPLKIPSTLMFLASGFQTIAILPKRTTCLQIVCEITFKSNAFPEQIYF